MTNITPLRRTPAPSIAFRYKQGDITRALLEGLRHEQVTADVEDVLSALLFSADDHAISNARDPAGGQHTEFRGPWPSTQTTGRGNHAVSGKFSVSRDASPDGRIKPETPDSYGCEN